MAAKVLLHIYHQRIPLCSGISVIRILDQFKVIIHLICNVCPISEKFKTVMVLKNCIFFFCKTIGPSQ